MKLKVMKTLMSRHNSEVATSTLRSRHEIESYEDIDVAT